MLKRFNMSDMTILQLLHAQQERNPFDQPKLGLLEYIMLPIAFLVLVFLICLMSAAGMFVALIRLLRQPDAQATD